MSVHTVRHRLNLGAAQTDRGFSPNIWADCPWEAIEDGEVAGATFFDDFVSFNITPATTEGNWAAGHGYAQFGSTGGAITAATGLGGEITIASDGDDEGASIRTLSTPFKIIRTQGKFWFECRIKFSSIADTITDVFIGLWENIALDATHPITATAGALSDNNWAGFHRLATDGDKVDTRYKANTVTAVTVGADAVTLVADTYVKLGMVFDPGVDPFVHDVGLTGGAKYLLTFYADNQRLASYKQIPTAAGTDFPNDVPLGLAFAILNAAGSSPGTATLDWWRAAQIFN